MFRVALGNFSSGNIPLKPESSYLDGIGIELWEEDKLLEINSAFDCDNELKSCFSNSWHSCLCPSRQCFT